MHKTPGWQNRLVAYLAAAGRERFVPGQHDCALFASGALAAMTAMEQRVEIMRGQAASQAVQLGRIEEGLAGVRTDINRLITSLERIR
ncbi:hypothetical protein C4N9_18570 [Pararhodobacter marinus]|uniref:DUF6950 domain-containing protein n=1 Tax=Pararhodobacter marinus TaxID=2184063 RepID=A0A2U2C546_9RHOB|nr:hypothetical protein [Pararhodobacter marinus]PWE27010.1 hypothetical protein C4N9_18570 [Pararhodobacter marinus]